MFWICIPAYDLSQVSQEEADTLVKNFATSGAFAEGGIRVSGQKYIATKHDDRSVYGRKVSAHNCSTDMAGARRCSYG